MMVCEGAVKTVSPSTIVTAAGPAAVATGAGRKARKAKPKALKSSAPKIILQKKVLIIVCLMFILMRDTGLMLFGWVRVAQGTN